MNNWKFWSLKLFSCVSNNTFNELTDMHPVCGQCCYENTRAAVKIYKKTFPNGRARNRGMFVSISNRLR